jgi:hypothetical protein
MGELVQAEGGAKAGIIPPKGEDGLTDRQRAFVAAMVQGEAPEDAARIAGYAEGTNPAAILASEAVAANITAITKNGMKGLKLKALQAMSDLLESGTAANTRFQAAKFVLEYGEGDGKDGDKPLSEMTEGELLAVVAKAKKAARDADQGSIIDITPHNGA